MSLNHVVLGLLSNGDLSGYDLKKLIQNSEHLYWSGNNNQVYKALSELLACGYVTNVLQYQEHSPNKKVYSITESGRDAFMKWIQSEIEPMEIKKPFLLRLISMKALSIETIKKLLDVYEVQLDTQLIMTRHNKLEREKSDGKEKLTQIVEMFINKNLMMSYQNEIVWIRAFRKAIEEVESGKHR